jgi:hypothetical protein
MATSGASLSVSAYLSTFDDGTTRRFVAKKTESKSVWA